MKTVLIVGGIIVFLFIVVFLWLFIARADESRRRGKHDDDRKNSEIHVCPILMRTVIFEDGFCLEDCGDRSDCPIMAEVHEEEDCSGQ